MLFINSQASESFCDTFVVHDEIGHFVINFVMLWLCCEFVIFFSGICDRFCDAVGQELSLSEGFCV